MKCTKLPTLLAQQFVIITKLYFSLLALGYFQNNLRQKGRGEIFVFCLIQIYSFRKICLDVTLSIFELTYLPFFLTENNEMFFLEEGRNKKTMCLCQQLLHHHCRR